MNAPLLDSARLLEEASAIGDQLARHRLRVSDGSATWRGPRQVTPESAHEMAVLGPHLFAGTAGVAVFLAALAQARGSADDRALCLQAIAPIRRKLEELVADPARAASLRLSIGAFTGIGSFLYALVTIGKLLGEPALLREARAASALITPERIAQDETLDVVGGSAGTILVLLALDRADPGPCAPGETPGETPLDRAAACARHLLGARVSQEGQPRAWPPVPGRAPLSGFAHGAAGICHALLQLHARLGQAELRDAAEEGLRYERSLFSPEHRNWRDMRHRDLRFMTSWCHGAPGITLARLGSLGVASSPDIHEDIEHGLATTRAFPLEDIDDLCCGNMGRAEILLFASQQLGRPELLDAARALAAEVLGRARESGHFKLPLADKGSFAPTLFKGAAGIGYTLLRLANPAGLPCLQLVA